MTGAGSEVVLMYVQPPALGREYRAQVDVLYVMQVWSRHLPIMLSQEASGQAVLWSSPSACGAMLDLCEEGLIYQAIQSASRAAVTASDFARQ